MNTHDPEQVPPRAVAGEALEELLAPLRIAAAETVRTWEPHWTPFLDPLVLREAEASLGTLADLHVRSEGGYGAALRRRLLLQRLDTIASDTAPPAALMGLEISGNFLFDPATPAEMREGLLQAGAAPGEVGDLWIRGDRGAQGVITEALATWLDGCLGQVRSVEVRFETRPLADLRFPAERAPRTLQTVEASLRVDAVASAGFGLSRTRLAALIRQGGLCVDWRPVTSPSQLVAAGQRIQLEGRGELEITSAEPTQRGRWRIGLTRR